ncbi:EamA family transporter [Clostridium felsineum]|uniref:DMT family transporter n=1 Tax=Clostridium felsineum TaxID=36839 RepID=UPI00214DE854|nr:EamA family transporter [Clostridium felsineum]MCR3758099.1 EamA family transporter [Clostridium felsineum]
MDNKKLAYLFLVITTSSWGSLYVVSKFVLNTMPPITVLFFRYVIAAIVLFIILKRRKKDKIAKEDYKYIFCIGFIGYFVSIAAQMIGTKLANASTASIINAMNPVFIIMFAVPILKEKVTINKVIAVAASIVGAYIIVGGGKGGALLGILFSVISVIMWSLMSVLVRRVTQKYDAVTITTYAIIIAMIFSLPASIVELSTTKHIAFTAINIVCLFYMGIICTAIPHLLWNKSLSMIEAGKCSLFYPLQPVVAAFLGFVFLGEIINRRFIIGSVLIISGILFSIFSDNKNLKRNNNKEVKKVS